MGVQQSDIHILANFLCDIRQVPQWLPGYLNGEAASASAAENDFYAVRYDQALPTTPG
jgi:hypothetical protein